jgi:tetratricopeptide (TPR) repeat protein
LTQLHVEIADLHNLAGWVSFDIGLYQSAQAHYRRALEQAEHAGDASLVANVVYRMGRLHLHLADIADDAAARLNHARSALRLFQLGQIAAQESGCGITVSMLCANEASAYAVLGEERQTVRSLARAADEFDRAEPTESPSWVRFFGTADLAATAGVANAALGRTLPRHREQAVAELTESIAARTSASARSRIFELTALATVHLLDGDQAHGLTLGQQAIELAEGVRSTRVIDRLAPLERAARARAGPDNEALAARISALRAA